MKRQNNQKANDKMTVVNPYMTIVILHVNGSNSLIKRDRVDGLKTRPNYMITTGDKCQLRGTHCPKGKRWKIFQASQ